MKNLFKKAHKMTKEIKEKYNDVDYKVQFSLCLSYLVEEDKKMEEKNIKDKLYELLEKACEEHGADNFNWNKWEKGEHKRIYMNLIWYKRSGGIKREMSCGYIDLIKEEYVYTHRNYKVYNLITKEKN
ncbi:hypothetical protein ACTPEO_17280 [Clostridioides difficile]